MPPAKLKILTTQEPSSSLSADLIFSKLKKSFKGGCKKILLIQPFPFNSEYFEVNQALNKRYYNWPPYGLGVLCKNIKKRGYEAKILDMNFDVLTHIQEQSETTMPDDVLARDEIKKIWHKKTESMIEDFKPDLVALTCMFTMGHEMLIRMADFIRKNFPNIPIIAGGVHITNAPEYVLREAPSLDFAGLYEGDVSFCDMLDVINNKANIEKLKQISTMIDDEYYAISSRTTPNSDELNVIPDYDNLSIGNYSGLGEVGSYRSWLPVDFRGASVLSNRGCRARCSFCSVRNFNGKSVRPRDVDSVVEEIEGLVKEHQIQHITWIDDDLFFDQKRSIELFNKISDKKLGITWCASNGIIASAAAKSEELIEASARSGCVGMTFGLESGSDKILLEVHKPSRVVHYYKVGEMLKKYPQIFTRGFLIIGFPKETLKQMLETVKMSQEVGLDWYGVQLLSPLPSTEIYDTMVELGLIDDVTIKKNKDKDGSKLFVVRQGEKQRAKEKEQKNNAQKFVNPFSAKNLDIVPSREELHDIWLLVDYWINYEPILSMTDKNRLLKKRAILRDICDRMTKNNPISNLFLGIVEEKLGNSKEGHSRKELALKYLSQSEYWKKQFEALELQPLISVA